MSSFNPIALNWGLTATACVLTVGRFAIRGYQSRRLFWDDFVHFLALAILVAHGFTDRVVQNAKAELAIAAKSKVSEADLLDQYRHLRYLNTINNCFLHWIFWTVKVAFLLFYYQIFKVSPGFKKAWWGVLVFTCVTFWVPIAGVIATCYNANTILEFKSCNTINEARAIKLKYSCAMNVATDLAIMALPLWQLKKLQVSMRQKLGLALVFSIATVCIVLDILRTYQSLSLNIILFTTLETNLVVIVSCLPTYRALLNLRQQRHPSRSTKYSKPPKVSWLKSISSIPARVKGDKSDNSDTAQLTTDSIYVTKAYNVTSGEREQYEFKSMESRSIEYARPMSPSASHTAFPPANSSMV